MDINNPEYHGSKSQNISNENGDKNASVEMNGDLLDYAERLANLTVDEIQGVRKMTKDRIYCLDISPSSSQICVAAGDKFGRDVDISADGSIIIVSTADAPNNADNGYVRIYKFD